MRSFLLADLLRRGFEYQGYKVKQVINITDIGHLQNDDSGEDKMTKALKREGKPLTLEAMKTLADFYTEKFKEDLQKLNVHQPHVMPKASEHISEDIALIKTLEKKSFTYQISDGIYFDTAKDARYGRLGGVGGGQARIEENREKRDSRDFALWKFNNEIGFPSPWGKGFPGWHIECSAMSQKYLGKTFDIHTGGIDLAPIHHNNEIAQSENACGCDFARYWLHNEFVNLGSEKMSKSEGNILKLKDIEEKGFSPLAFRYFLLLSHYRTPTNFSWEALEAAQNAYKRLKEFTSSLPKGHIFKRGKVHKEYKNKFVSAIENDLNLPEALAVTWEVVKDDSISPLDKRATLLNFDKVLGLKLDEVEKIPKEILSLAEDRQKAKKAKDFAKADALRAQITAKGYEVRDLEGDSFTIVRI